MIKEEWKDIPGYEGLYKISNYGRVKATARVVLNKNGEEQFFNEKILKPFKCGRYFAVALCKDSRKQNKYIHRMVAEAFIPNPKRYKEINHITEDKSRNESWLLEWCDHLYNCNFGTRNKRLSEMKKSRS